MDLVDSHRTSHAKTKETHFSADHAMFSTFYQILGHKASLNKLRKIEIVSSSLPDYSGRKLPTNRNFRKYTNSWRLNNTLLNSTWVKEEYKEINNS